MKKLRPTVAPQIIDEASEWFIAMREPTISPEVRENFSQWLCASPVNVGAYLDIARLWGDTAHIPAELQVDITGNVVELSDRIACGARPDVSAKKTSARLPVSRMAATALIGVGLAATGVLLHTEDATTFSTSVGEQRTLTLEDGSLVKLNARSTLRVRMTEELRRIELIDGQALFEVAKNPQRPFIVSVGHVAVRAVGTQFDIYRKAGGTMITVVEGKVSVSPTRNAQNAAALDSEVPARPNSDRGGNIFLIAGQQITVGSGGKVVVPAKPNIAAATSWTQQELIFDGQPLGEVIAEFNRYSRTPVVLADPSLAELRVNAVFHTTTPDALLKFVSRLDGVEADRSGREILIKRTR